MLTWKHYSRPEDPPGYYVSRADPEGAPFTRAIGNVQVRGAPASLKGSAMGDYRTTNVIEAR